MSRTDHHLALGHCQLTISAAPRLFWSAELCSALLITAALHCTTCQQPQTIVCSAGSPGTTPTSQDKKSYKLAKFTTQSSVWWWLDLGQTWDMTPRDSVVATTKIFGTRNYFRPLLLSASRSRDTCDQVVDNLKSFRVTAGEKKSNLSGVVPVLSRQRKLVNWCLIVSKLRSRQERKHTSVITARF